MGMSTNMNGKLKLNVSGLRWGLAAVLAVLALVAAVQSIRTYQAHEMTTGLMAVVALAILLVVGLVSLAQARLRIGRELAALRAAARGHVGHVGDAGDEQPARSPGGVGATPRAPVSELLAARRLRLEAIRAAGVRPDSDVLADATRADEAGRAYIGRYLVATTVLIGLVGTFAGLMQTLGKMAPLLGDKGGGDIALLVTPLAGLHVTFGASLVAILSTLALALAQGDLALGEEQALALLEDHSKHHLVPRLWPGGDDTGERTVRAVEDLKAVFADTLARSIDVSLRNISESASAQAERSARALEQVAATIEKDVTRLCETIEGGLAQGVLRQAQALADATKAHTETLAQTTATVNTRLGEAASTLMAQLRGELAGAITRSVEAGNTALAAASEASNAAVARSTSLAEEVTRRCSAASEEAARRAATAVEELSRLAATALAESMARGAVVLEESLQRATGTAAELMRGTTEASERASQATTEAVTRTLEPLLSREAERLDGVREALAEVGTRVDATAGRLVELTSGLEGLARAHIDSIDRSGQAVLAAFDRAVVGGGAALDAAAGTLGTAARELQSGAEMLAPRLATLTTELGGLSREVALLLAARGPDGADLELGAVVLGELDRLGGSVERLTAL
ncbi:MAG: hypothetical protein ABJA82_12075, partial [Myxococcales bacterium]